MTYLDPASASEHIANISKAVGLTEDQVVEVSRRWESVRSTLGSQVLQIVQLDQPAIQLFHERVDAVVARVISLLERDAEVPTGTEPEKAFLSFKETISAFLRADLSVRIGSALVRALRIRQDGTASIDPGAFATDIQVDEGGKLLAVFEDTVTKEERRVGRAAWILAVLRSRDFAGLAPEEKSYAEFIGGRDLDTNLYYVVDDKDKKTALYDPVTEQELKSLEYILERSEPGYHSLSNDKSRQEVLERETAAAKASLSRIPDNHPALEGMDHIFVREARSRLEREEVSDFVAQVLAEIFRLAGRVAEWDHSNRVREMAKIVVSLQDDGVLAEVETFPREIEVCRRVQTSTGIVEAADRADVERARGRFDVIL